MKTLSFISWLACAQVCCLGTAAVIEPPILINKVEPDYPGLISAYIVDVTTVEMTVAEDGIPFALNASEELPDEVVTALSQWQFRPGKKDGRDTAFDIKLTVPVRRAITPTLEASYRLSWWPSGELLKIMETGRRMTPDEAIRIEKRLKKLNDPAEERTKLLEYYTAQSASETTRAARNAQIIWLIQNHPDSEILGSPVAVINAAGEPLADPKASAQAEAVWLQRIAKDRGDFKILGYAMNFLRVADPTKAAEILLGCKGWPKSALWLGNEYGLGAIGVTGLLPTTGQPIIHADDHVSEFSIAARTALLASTDAKVVLSGLAAVTSTGRALAAQNHLPSGYSEFCETLLQHAKQLYPKTSFVCDVSGDKDQVGLAGPTSGRHVTPARLIKKVQPKYPPAAERSGVQGVVKLSALINKQGQIEDLEFLSGPLVFYVSARSAVSHWEYEPTKVDENPITVRTTITVNYFMRGH
ncbi:MAG TPA: energy transducer TonB [Bryobacteraceae bacterium]|nr:energy transducer TonB [Bryobacteraceae bacterium]